MYLQSYIRIIISNLILNSILNYQIRSFISSTTTLYQLNRIIYNLQLNIISNKTDTNSSKLEKI